MDLIYDKIIMIPAILLAFTFHEFAHAKVADVLGDKTPRFQGRLTLNPIKHIDPIGFLLIILVGFGWAKPVETNPSAYKNYYKDDLKVSLAGPLTNLVLSFLGCLLWMLLIMNIKVFAFLPISILVVISDMLRAIFTINACLFIFNLLPLPGLDGFAVLRDLAPSTFNRISDSIYRYQGIIMILIVVAGSRFLSVPVVYVQNFIMKIVSVITGF